MKRHFLFVTLAGILMAAVLSGCGEDLLCGDSTTGVGTMGAPVGLTVGAAATPGQVGGAIGSDHSYYAFTSDGTGTTTLTIASVTNGADLQATLYSGTFGSFVTICDTSGPNSSDVCTPSTTASSPFSLDVYNKTCNSTTYTIQLL